MRGMYIWIWLLASLFGCSELRESSQMPYQTIAGETMGTYYRITFQETNHEIPDRPAIEDLLGQINQAVSTYIEKSAVSQFNRSQDGITADQIEDTTLQGMLFDNVSIGFDLFTRTNGYFDPTVMPLVNYWGFGYEPRTVRTLTDSTAIDSILQLVGLAQVTWIRTQPQQLQKSRLGVELDFSASAKGYAIDQIAMLLEKEYGVEHYLIDIGGEASAAGINAEGNIWRIGIENPDAIGDVPAYSFVLNLADRSVATSGNYRNFYISEGKTISHTMNPKTGYFERNDLLSASVVAPDCAIADGFATACMAMGFADALKMITLEPSLEALFIYIDDEGSIQHFITPGLRSSVTTRKG